MLGLPLAFSAPLVLAALALLPALYYLLRLTPPRPREIAFPPLKLILDLKPLDETPARTPWWLMLLRLTLAALVIFAMAGPIWNPAPLGDGGKGPLLAIIDDGWPAAPTWAERVTTAGERILAAGRDSRVVGILPMSDGARDVVATDSNKALERLRAMKPMPFAPDRMSALPAAERFLAANKQAEIVWLADGLESGNARAFAEGLIKAAGDRVVQVLTRDQPQLAVSGAENNATTLEATVVRPAASGRSAGVLRALDIKGVSVGEAPFDMGSATEAKASFNLPLELRNDIARLEIADERSAGAVTLLDSRWKRRRVGVVSGETADTAQPLLSPSYYVLKALAPFADVREPRANRGDPVLSMLDDQVSALVLTDVGVVAGPARDKLAKFVEDGGLLIRFAGARLANASDDLVPVRLRRGGRVLGGALSWEKPKALAPFDKASPLYGIDVTKEVTVTRQVLAEPEAGLPGKTWAALADGTPLITAERRGKGLIVLVHVTADTTWSNLPLSGMFVDILRRVVSLSAESVGADNGDAANGAVDHGATVAPTRTLDGFGTLGPPPIAAKPIPARYDGGATADHPPGFYGPQDALIAVNTLAPGARLAPADFSGLKLQMEALRKSEPIDLRPLLVTLAAAALLLDALASLWLAGGFNRRTRRPAIAAFVAGFVALGTLAAPGHARAQAASQRDMDAALKTHLAYIVTGDARIDEASQVGLANLSRVLAARTAMNPGEPMGLDPGRDELAFYPFIYWPIAPERPLLGADATTKISNYMKQGGMIVFDTRDALNARAGGPPTPEQVWLRKLLANVDVPELEPVPRDHVVTKTFYLLTGFVGRTTIGQTWIEALPPETSDEANRPARSGDGVSPIVITSNDLAAAWAVDRDGAPLYPLTPNSPRQREMALRGGVNLVMYTLTGNYKADQVHVRDLLERLAH